MAFEDLRSFLAHLDGRGELATVDDAVDPRYEIAAYIRRSSDVQGPAFLFNHVKGSPMRAVGGLFRTRGKALHALEVERHSDAVERFMDAIANPIDPVVLPDGPCKEVVLTGDDVDLGELPIPVYSEQDPGAFITVGVQITKDPETGARNAGIYRMQLHGRRELGLAASPYADFDAMYKRAEAAGRRLELAVAVGVDPVTQLATQARVPYGFDELTVAGACTAGHWSWSAARRSTSRCRPQPRSSSRAISSRANGAQRDPSASSPATSGRAGWSLSSTAAPSPRGVSRSSRPP